MKVVWDWELNIFRSGELQAVCPKENKKEKNNALRGLFQPLSRCVFFYYQVMCKLNPECLAGKQRSPNKDHVIAQEWTYSVLSAEIKFPYK